MDDQDDEVKEQKGREEYRRILGVYIGIPGRSEYSKLIAVSFTSSTVVSGMYPCSTMANRDPFSSSRWFIYRGGNRRRKMISWCSRGCRVRANDRHLVYS